MKEPTGSGYYWVRTRDDGGPFMGHLGDDGWWQVRVVNQYCLYPPHLIEVLSDRLDPPKPTLEPGVYLITYNGVKHPAEWVPEENVWYTLRRGSGLHPNWVEVVSDRLEPPA